MKKLLLVIISIIGFFIFLSVTVSMCSTQISENKMINNETLKDSIDEIVSEEKITKINEEKIKQLKPLFNEKVDKYDVDKKIWISPKNAPNYNNQKGNYLYFESKNNIASNLRFRFQYYNDDWLFIENLVFLIDEEPIKYIPKSHIERDNEGGKIWEWFDDSVNKSDLILFEKISNAKKVEIKINGKQYFEERTLTKKDIESFKATLEYYKALNGE